MKFKLLVLLPCLLIGIIISAQEKSKIKFGKIEASDFVKSYAIDTSADAVVIADIGNTEVEKGKNTHFALVFKHFRRMHILKKSGYDNGSFEVYVHVQDEAEEELVSLKATTYNLENGRVVETKMDPRTGVFKEKVDKNLSIRKFTFPNLKEGSIIEFEYKLKSEFIRYLRPWVFQGGIPRLWSEYNVQMPEFYQYVTLSQGHHPFFIKEQKDKLEAFSVEDDATGAYGGTTGRTLSFTAGVTTFRWVMKDVPALKMENYTSSLDNHISKIEFQLSELRGPIYIPKTLSKTWKETTAEYLNDAEFGQLLDKDNSWMNDAIQAAEVGAATPLAQSKGIFEYIRDNLTSTGSDWYPNKPLKSTLKSRVGSVADINMLLTAMLRKAGFNADPVIMSTRSNGFVYSEYPMLSQFNYLICRLTLNGQSYYLDASKPRLGFNRLTYDCYNGHARVMNQAATPLEFMSDSLKEVSLTSVFIRANDNGSFSGSFTQTPGYYHSYDIRDEVQSQGKQKFLAEFAKSFSPDVKPKDLTIDSLSQYELPITMRYGFDLPMDNADILYINPLFGEGWKSNPFKSAERYYPVEMPFARDEIYILQFAIPPGYVVDELPKQVKVKLNAEDDGSFEYLLSESNGIISLRSRIQLKKAFYTADEYEGLREFFNLIVKKHGEQIVLKKK